MTESHAAKPIRAGIYPSLDRAEQAVRELLDAGFRKEQITVVCSDKSREEHFGSLQHDDAVDETSSGGEAKAGLLGGALGGLVSLAGVATAGGVGIVAVGPVLAGGMAGTLVALLIGRGVEDELARFYDQAVTKGNLLVAVEDDSGNRLQQAEAILRDAGAEPVELEKE